MPISKEVCIVSLKIQNKDGETVAVLKDEDNSPQVVKPVVKEEEKCPDCQKTCGCDEGDTGNDVV
jgi:hypothetical protein